MNETPKLLQDSFSKKNIIIALLIFISIFIVITYLLIHYDTFDTFYDYTRAHENWELDEIILGIFTFFIALSFALFYLTISFGKRIIEHIKIEAKQEKQLQVNQKLLSMGSMLGGLAHSLNNHLVPIITLSKIIKEDTPKESPISEDISKVLEASFGMRDILKQILNFTRQDNTAVSNSCNVDETLVSTLNLAKATVPSSIKFEIELEKTQKIIPISRVNIEIILFNLITNAKHAIEEKKHGVIQVNCFCLYDKIVITIKDNGCGIKKEQQALIFDPFYTTKEQGKGTGLGLSETFGIIKNAGGTITVDSKENEYTEFTLEIPTIKEYK